MNIAQLKHSVAGMNEDPGDYEESDHEYIEGYNEALQDVLMLLDEAEIACARSEPEAPPKPRKHDYSRWLRQAQLSRPW